MLIILSASPGTLLYSCVLLGSLLVMSVWSVRSLLLASVSSSRAVRKDMKDWVLSQEGHKWSVKFDVRDLGGHLDTTCRGWSATPSSRVRIVIAQLVLIFALPLDFHGASDGLRKLRSSIHRVVWSRRQPLASIDAVLNLMDGPTGCHPAFCVVWFRLRLLRSYLALWPSQVGRAYRLLEMVG